MRNLLLLLVGFILVLTCPFFGMAQSKLHPKGNSHNRLSSDDSVRSKKFLRKAFGSRLGSTKWQLYLDSALQIDPTNSYYWQQKAMPLFKAKKYEIGLVFLDSAVKNNPTEYMDYRAFMKCIFQKCYRNSIQDFDQAVLLKGNGQVMDHSYLFYKGLCYLQLNELDSAQHFLSKVIENKRLAYGQDWLRPTELFYLAIVYYEKEERNQAITLLDQALKLYPKFSDAHYFKALCLAGLGQKQLALAEMEEAQTYFNLGYTLNEDNVFYEDYPYQIKKYKLESSLTELRYKLGQKEK